MNAPPASPGDLPRRIRVAVLTAAMLATFGSCGGIPRTHYYILEPRPAEAAPKPMQFQGRRVSLGPVRVLPPYDGDRIVYREGASNPELGFYHYHRWAAPLERMLPPVLEALWDLGGGNVASRAAVAEDAPPLELLVIVRKIEELDLPEGPVAQVDLECALRDPTTGQTLWRGSVSKRVPAAAAEMRDIVEAMARAVAEAAGEVAARLADASAAPAQGQGPS